jgi:hypothetical protein
MSTRFRAFPEIKKAITQIRVPLEDLLLFEEKMRALRDRFGHEAVEIHDYQADIDSIYNEIDHIIRSIILFPPHHIKHFSLLDSFFQPATFERSVFVMTKFPDEGDARKDTGLNSVINTVLKTLESKGYVGRLARGNAQYHDSLWDNVELHLLACSRGVAIVEDKSKGELNPNVAMEWGFLKAFGRPVLYLEEVDFKHQRPDWHGLIRHHFKWDEPEEDIQSGVTEWLSSSRGGPKGEGDVR